jgi:hypothetical protein
LRGELNFGGKMKLSKEELEETKKFHNEVRIKRSNDALEYVKLMLKEQLKKNEHPFERIVIFVGWGDELGNLDENGEYKIYMGFYKRIYRNAGFQEDDQAIRMWVVQKDDLYPVDVIEL